MFSKYELWDIIVLESFGPLYIRLTFLNDSHNFSATLENIVMKAIFLEIPTLHCGLSSWDLFIINLYGYLLFNRFTLRLFLNFKNVSNASDKLFHFSNDDAFISSFLDGKMLHVCLLVSFLQAKTSNIFVDKKRLKHPKKHQTKKTP